MTRIATSPTRELVPVLHRVERVLGLGQRMDADGQSVLQSEAPVPREVVGMGVRLEHPDDADAPSLRLLEVRLDRVGGIDDHRLTARLVADQVGRAAEILVDALLEDHCRATVPTAPASFLEVTASSPRAPSGRLVPAFLAVRPRHGGAAPEDQVVLLVAGEDADRVAVRVHGDG